MPTTMLNSKTVTLDELGLRAVPATPTMISQIMTSIGMTVPPRYADTSPAYGTALGSDAVMIEITWREVS